jgi:hypothetical protein
MRPTNSSAASYQPGDPPADPAQMQRFLREELAKIKAAYDVLADGFAPVTYMPPAKPRMGMTRYADGNQWDPGSGEGFYYYNSHGVWTPFG